MVLEVKGGKSVTIQALRALRGVLDSDSAQMAGLIVMAPLKTIQQRNFDSFMAQAGDLELSNISYPRMQLLTVPDQGLEGKRFQFRTLQGVTRRRQRLFPI